MSPEEKLTAAIMSVFDDAFAKKREASERRLAELEHEREMINEQKARMADIAQRAREAGNDYAGRTVYFAKVPRCTLRGNRINKFAFAKFAEAHGMIISKSITKKLEILVVPCDELESDAAIKAAQNGTRVLTERAFWKIVGLLVDG